MVCNSGFRGSNRSMLLFLSGTLNRRFRWLLLWLDFPLVKLKNFRDGAVKTDLICCRKLSASNECRRILIELRLEWRFHSRSNGFDTKEKKYRGIRCLNGEEVIWLEADQRKEMWENLIAMCIERPFGDCGTRRNRKIVAATLDVRRANREKLIEIRFCQRITLTWSISWLYFYLPKRLFLF